MKNFTKDQHESQSEQWRQVRTPCACPCLDDWMFNGGSASSDSDGRFGIGCLRTIGSAIDVCGAVAHSDFVFSEIHVGKADCPSGDADPSDNSVARFGYWHLRRNSRRSTEWDGPLKARAFHFSFCNCARALLSPLFLCGLQIGSGNASTTLSPSTIDWFRPEAEVRLELPIQ